MRRAWSRLRPRRQGARRTEPIPVLQVLGPHNTGTNFVIRILRDSGFRLEVHKQGHTRLWKHTLPDLIPEGLIADPSVRFLVLVKHPAFWFASMRKASYAAHLDDDGSVVMSSWGDIVFDDHRFPSLAEMWNWHYRTYLDRLPEDRTIVVRYEDALFDPERVVRGFGEWIGQHARHQADYAAILAEPAKPHGSPRHGEDALAHHARSPDELFGAAEYAALTAGLDAELLARFGYEL